MHPKPFRLLEKDGNYFTGFLFASGIKSLLLPSPLNGERPWFSAEGRDLEWMWSACRDTFGGERKFSENSFCKNVTEEINDELYIS